ncbi:MAG TPA: aminotransferase class V-fold PLP-dependent enzyme [Acetobacteraceae bacterium]
MTQYVPLLGQAVRHEWALDWDFLSVNHGSFGAAPRVVLAAQRDWQRRLEAQPGRFMRAVLPDALRHAADRLGMFIGADGKDVAFVDNATTGCNAVLRSLRLAPDDEIMVLSHGYGAVRNTVRYLCERASARMVEAEVPFPHPNADAIVANIAAALTPRTRLAVVDHITSGSALVLPLRRIVEACHAAGVPVLVDGAHGPAQVPLELRVLGADWYAGNCHKWLCAPKGSAFLYARPDRQDDLHPATISHGLGKGYLEEFDWTGTRDPSAWLATHVAIDFHARLGGETLMARNIALAADATSLLARRLNTEPGATGAMAGCMGVVRLPLAGAATTERSADLRARLLAAGTDAPTHVQAGAIWLRLSAAAYNDIEDFERLAEIVARVLREAG